METLKLTFPSLQAGQEFMLDTSPNAVSKWVNELAYSDIDHAINEMTRVVRTLNRSRQKAAHREENLFTIDKAYLQISRHFREQNDKRAIKVDTNQYKALHNLTTEMAFAAKRVLDEISSQKFLLKKNQRLAKAINFSQHYLGLMLIEQYQLYAPIPSYIWRELHMLYRFAEANKFHTSQLHKGEEPLEPLQTIKHTYIRNCLMAVINPYHIEDNQHWQLFKYLSHWGHVCSIVNDTKQYRDSQCLIIDLNDSNKPHFADDNSEYDDEEQIRLLMTDQLLATVKQHLDQFNQNRSLPMPAFYAGIDLNHAEKLMQRVYAYCDHHVERKSARYPIMADVDTVWGLPYVIKTLQQDSNLTGDTDLDINLQKMLGSQYETNIRWQAVNHSDGGMCIKQVKQDINELKVGNLILLKRHINGIPQKTWQLAISRWLNGDQNSGSTVGLEFIHGNCEEIYYLTKDKDGETIRHSVVLVKPFDSSYPLLIAPKNLIGKQKLIQIEQSGKATTGHLTNVIETSTNLAIFGVRID
ncbi:MAG: hypothetical protein HWD86_02860 [Kangiellaceae bacterium]|nr:hypothetical protein [Kangiellaceae bacterium]